MPDDLSDNLNLPLLLPAQAQKHVTHNEALVMLDALVLLSVINRTQTTLPASPQNGDRYIVPASAAAAWGGAANALASYSNGGWVFYSPQPGWRAWVIAEGKEIVWHANAWQDNGISGTQTAMLGINTAPNATNRFAAASPATLLTHTGAGHQLKVNKAASSDTASLLFQTGFSGRAEIGLAGNDALSIKVSANGTTWQNALSIAPATGAITGTAITQNAFDVTAARLTKSGDFGMGIPLPLASGSNLATLNLPNGLYSYKASTVSGGPESAAQPHCMLVMQAPASVTGSDARRVFLSMRNSNQNGDVHAWIGQKGASASAISWQPLYTGQSAVGTVAQQNGQPSGAIIQKGSGSNGTYTRFADGTQICAHSVAASTSSALTWTFPAAFSQAPQVTGTAQANVCAAVVFDSAPTASNAALSVRGADGARRGDTLSLMAVGRWF